MVKEIKVRQRLNLFIARNIDSYFNFDVLEKFMVGHLVIASKSFTDYQCGRVSAKRRKLILLMRAFSILTAIRYMSSALINTDLVSVLLMADPHYLLGHKRINSFMLSSAIIIGNILLGGLHLILEGKGKLTILSFFYGIQHKTTTSYALNRYYYRKYCLKKNILTKYALNSVMFIPIIILNIVYFWGLTIIAYLDPGKNFSPWSISFWNFIQVIWIYDLFGIAMGGVAYYYLSTLYLKYQFRQLDEEIKNSIAKRNIPELREAIRAHNTVSVSTHKLNIMFKYVIFIIYFFVKVPLNGLLYISHSPDTHIYARVVMATLLVVCIGILFVVNLMSATVNKWAHNRYTRIFSLLCSTRMPLNSRLCIQGFSERLSGPGLGFYCLNMFVINNYVFFDYIIGWISNYFLIIGLIKRIGVH